MYEDSGSKIKADLQHVSKVAFPTIWWRVLTESHVILTAHWTNSSNVGSATLDRKTIDPKTSLTWNCRETALKMLNQLLTLHVTG